MYKLLRKRLFGKKGFTLTELIVVVAIVALLMACVAAFAQPVKSMIKGSTDKSDALTINEAIGNFIEHKLAYANYIKVYAGRDYDKSDTEMQDTYNFIKAKKGETGQTNQPGILIFRFESNPSDRMKNTMKIYDIKINSSADPMPAGPGVNDKAFIDEFYGGQSFFFCFDDFKIPTNSRKKTASFNMRIESYTFDEQTASTQLSPTGTTEYVGITRANCTDYYKYIDPASIFSTYTTNPFDNYIDCRTGVENVSFNLLNIQVVTESTPDPANPGEYIISTHPNSAVVTKGIASGTNYQSDLVIFYNVRTFDTKSDTM